MKLNERKFGELRLSSTSDCLESLRRVRNLTLSLNMAFLACLSACDYQAGSNYPQNNPDAILGDTDSGANSDSEDFEPATDSLQDSSTQPEPEFHECLNPEVYQTFSEIRARIPIALHILKNSEIYENPVGDDIPMVSADIESIKRDFIEANRAFESLGVDFYFTEVEEIDNPDFYLNSDINQFEHEAKLEQFALDSDVEGAIDVYYAPQYSNKGGLYIPNENGEGMVFVFYSSFESSDDAGRSKLKNLTHEIGHYFGLEHPQDGDGLESTLNYTEFCPWDEITYVKNGVCMVSCSDGSNESEANVMSYHSCKPEVSQDFNDEQISAMNCYLQEELTYHLESELPEVEF